MNEQLEVSNPMHVLAGIHLSLYGRMTGRGAEGIELGIAKAIGMNKIDGTWREGCCVPVALQPQDVKLIWVYMNLMDWLSFTLWGLPLGIEEDVDDRFLINEFDQASW